MKSKMKCKPGILLKQAIARNVHGRVHREDGPAIEWASGEKEWFLNGIKYSEQEFNAIQLSKKLQLELSEEHQQ